MIETEIANSLSYWMKGTFGCPDFFFDVYFLALGEDKHKHSWSGGKINENLVEKGGR